MKLQQKRDVIDLMLPNDLDLSGWELRKTLQLFSTCNLALNEWLGSPEVYWEQNEFHQALVDLIPVFFNPRKAMHHYLSMARKTAEENFEGNTIGIKKIFYILRPLLACEWIIQKQSMPPTEFQKLLVEHVVDQGPLKTITEMLSQKETAVEGHKIEVSKDFREWIAGKIEFVEENLPGPNKWSWDELNSLMRNWVTKNPH